MEVRRQWANNFRVLKVKQSRYLYSVRTAFKRKVKTKTFPDIKILKGFSADLYYKKY